MSTNSAPTIRHEELQASLARLGVKELEERMEVSPLLAASNVHTMDRCVCESCCSKFDLPEPRIGVDLGDSIGGVNHLGI